MLSNHCFSYSIYVSCQVTMKNDEKTKSNVEPEAMIVEDSPVSIYYGKHFFFQNCAFRIILSIHCFLP